MAWTDALPAIGTFLSGPVGGIAGVGIQWIAEKLGAKDSTLDSVKNVLSNMTPDQVLATKKIDIEFQMFCLDNSIKLNLAQISVNLEEAKSSNLLVSGWRPACGWICAFALGYVAIIEPLARFVSQVLIGYLGAFPAIDTTLTMQVLFGMLGIGAMRSYDKKQGTA
jgi:hypothetical protein